MQRDIIRDKYAAPVDEITVDLDLMREQLELEQALARIRHEIDISLMSDDFALTNRSSRYHDLKRAERDLKVRLKNIIEMRECR